MLNSIDYERVLQRLLFLRPIVRAVKGPQRSGQRSSVVPHTTSNLKQLIELFRCHRSILFKHTRESDRSRRTYGVPTAEKGVSRFQLTPCSNWLPGPDSN